MTGQWVKGEEKSLQTLNQQHNQKKKMTNQTSSKLKKKLRSVKTLR